MVGQSLLGMRDEDSNVCGGGPAFRCLTLLRFQGAVGLRTAAPGIHLGDFPPAMRLELGHMSQIVSLLHTPLPSVFHTTRDNIHVLGMSCGVHHSLGVSTTGLPPASPLTLPPPALSLLSSVARASLLDPEHAQPAPCLSFPPGLPAQNACCGSGWPCGQPSDASNSSSIDSVCHRQAVQGLAGMAPLGSTGSQLGAPCLPPSGHWSEHSALLGPMGRLSVSQAPLPSARALPSAGRTRSHSARQRASCLWGEFLPRPLGGQSIHVNKCLTYQTASIR